MKNKTVSILLVEDDEVDRMAVERSFDKHKIANPITCATDGVQALEILRNQSENTIKKPFVILLDLNMPRMGGLEFLKEIREDQDLKNSIIFVLTTSDDDRDIVAAYEKNIAGYILKSNAGVDFSNLIMLLDSYWRYVELPTK